MTRMTTPDVLGEVLTGASADDVAVAMGPQAQRVATVHVRLDGGTQPRAGIDQAVVDDYHSDMQAGAQFPPIELVYDGTDYWLWDGFHRFHALRKDGDRLIAANVRQGTRRDAVLLSVGANATHGFRRTTQDKQRAIETLLRDPEWSQWSDREIARRCAVDGKTVAARRAALSAEFPQIETRRVARQGTEYDMAVPQRSTTPAQGGQAAKWASQVDLQLGIGDWLDAFDDPEPILDELARDGQDSVLWEDVAGSMPVHREADLVVAIAALRERMAATRKQIDKPAATLADDVSECAMTMKVERSGFHRGTPNIKFTCTTGGGGGIVTATVTEDQVRLYASAAVLTAAEWRKLRDGIDLAFDELGR